MVGCTGLIGPRSAGQTEQISFDLPFDDILEVNLGVSNRSYEYNQIAFKITQEAQKKFGILFPIVVITINDLETALEQFERKGWQSPEWVQSWEFSRFKSLCNNSPCPCL